MKRDRLVGGVCSCDEGQEMHPVYGYSLCTQILRMLKDYNCHNTLLLPPRAPGESLPPEVLEYGEEQKRLQHEQEKSKTGESAGQDNGEGLILAVLSMDTANFILHRKPMLSSAACCPAWWRNS